MRLLIPTLAILIAAAQLPAAAQSNAQQQSQEQSRAAEIEACMREARAGSKTGQKGGLTPQQRMVAEEQCRARAEAAAQKKK
jgi:type II secretory pathway pseudopilin PulG